MRRLNAGREAFGSANSFRTKRDRYTKAQAAPRAKKLIGIHSRE
jgi:hypothetical protein